MTRPGIVLPREELEALTGRFLNEEEVELLAADLRTVIARRGDQLLPPLPPDVAAQIEADSRSLPCMTGDLR